MHWPTFFHVMNKKRTVNCENCGWMGHDVSNCMSNQSLDINKVSLHVVNSMKYDGTSKNPGDRKTEKVGIIKESGPNEVVGTMKRTADGEPGSNLSRGNF